MMSRGCIIGAHRDTWWNIRIYRLRLRSSLISFNNCESQMEIRWRMIWKLGIMSPSTGVVADGYAGV